MLTLKTPQPITTETADAFDIRLWELSFLQPDAPATFANVTLKIWWRATLNGQIVKDCGPYTYRGDEISSILSLLAATNGDVDAFNGVLLQRLQAEGQIPKE